MYVLKSQSHSRETVPLKILVFQNVLLLIFISLASAPLTKGKYTEKRSSTLIVGHSTALSIVRRQICSFFRITLDLTRKARQADHNNSTGELA
jgi:hypothetical protein